MSLQVYLRNMQKNNKNKYKIKIENIHYIQANIHNRTRYSTNTSKISQKPNNSVETWDLASRYIDG